MRSHLILDPKKSYSSIYSILGSGESSKIFCSEEGYITRLKKRLTIEKQVSKL